MVATLEDTKRQAIAMKLADMKALQNLLIANEQLFINSCNDSELCDRFRDMLEDDRKNMGVLETTIVQYGIQSEPKETTTKMIEEIQKLMEGSELTMFEKVGQHELLKHKQTMAGLLIHKAAQVVGADIEAAITPLNTVNFENRAHQEQLKGVLEILGVRELTGKDPDQGVWARVQDAMAAMSGIIGGAVTRTKEEMNITEIISMDHRKVDTIFMEIEKTDNPQKLQEFFGQLYKDLSVHAEAEEQIVYPAVRSYYSDTQELYDEQAAMKQMLAQIKALNPSSSDFKAQIQQLKKAVQDHVKEEENDMFPQIRRNLSEAQMEQMATQFKEAKSTIQQEMAGIS
ncbi:MULTISPECIES: hemerythrin domain-containing protein [unclassified Microcoleus]|uniref:hemerythrin domain-containing protein n=1 Tax=unclassified Microcoleus TaxID=2642155 RepID=UPI001D2F1B19|nr:MULTISPECIES: hemerythrin domain-containing protein [unclassified Microcoleus]TAE41972.1 MAG: DNA nickase [Oscillatoriales cyanobacterium]MCC3410297.1 hemerythrin domain-containing protein [Microcoleus sp. PH2017_02_FOX_O_A]MCC3492671.1 hemerythrin domain-containing protein [Microcoleus sp. PH2017_16_JOR_D_A]MCC3515814.1 hemerythrin domain-containing protein [Microcoleus sp. PH2017_18_LLB_O_A]MCC3536482.1 hemerythrin domain-containing protein [Microcoleus sp. PH2017_25_DOB_D_A]